MLNALPIPGGGGSSAFAPPLRFNLPRGVIRSAAPIPEGPFANVTKLSGSPAQKNGKRYERKVQQALTERLGGEFTPGQWFRFLDESGRRFCQVDGLFHSSELTAIFEVKYSFTADAWWQLRKLYEPVIRKALEPKRLALFLICKNFDPHVPFPEPVRLISPSALRAGWEGDTAIIDVIPWRL